MKYFIGIDIGGMSLKTGVVDTGGRILQKETCRTNPDRPHGEIIKDIFELCVLAAKNAGLSQSNIAGVGIGSPGTVNPEKGLITFSGNLNFKSVKITEEFKKHWDIPVAIGNDADCAALGESQFGSGSGSKNSITITLGTGIGTGFIIDGKIFTGKDGEGAEGGHTAIKLGGQKCGCGQKGCWEAYASATALINQTKLAMRKNPESLLCAVAAELGKVSARVAFLAMKKGDKTAERVVKNYIRYIGAGIVNLVNIFRPETVIIGGGVSNEGAYLIDSLQKYVDKNSFGGALNTVPVIKQASLGNDSGIIGAAALIMKQTS